MATQYDGMVASFSAGVNSAAMLIWLVDQGWHGDIVFADTTGAEWPETLCYMNYFERQYLMPRGLYVNRLKPADWVKKSGGKSLMDYCWEAHVIPMAAVRWCTAEFKAKPIERFLGDRTPLIGIAAEEAHRKQDAVRPLVDAGIDRDECKRIIAKAGLDVPNKSGCFICPFQPKGQWRTLYDVHPDLWDLAARLEENVKRGEGRQGKITLDINGKYTLREKERMFKGQATMDFFDDAELMVYRPCMCEL